jgi:hypothetical protein
MDSMKNRDSVYYSYIIINIFWYALCGSVIIMLGIVFIQHAFGNLLNTMSVQIPINVDQVTEHSAIDSSMISIDSAMASLNIEYIINNHFGLYIGMMLSLVMATALFLIGFFQLRMILKSALNDEIFTSDNIKRLKIIAGIVIAYAPFQWIVYQLFVVPIDRELIVNEITISLNFELGSFVFGLLLFALAAVFERGHEMYQELKLTV